MTEWHVRTGSAADLNLVGPLWVAVHHRHVETMPQLAPNVSDDETWRVRRGLYEDLLAKPDTLLLLAVRRRGGRGLRPCPRHAGGRQLDSGHLGNWATDRRDRIPQCATAIPWWRAGL